MGMGRRDVTSCSSPSSFGRLESKAEGEKCEEEIIQPGVESSKRKSQALRR